MSYQNPNFDKELYMQRRKKGLRGQIGHAIVVQLVTDENGKTVEVIPVSGKRPPRSVRLYTQRPQHEPFRDNRINIVGNPTLGARTNGRGR